MVDSDTEDYFVCSVKEVPQQPKRASAMYTALEEQIRKSGNNGRRTDTTWRSDASG